MILYFFLIFIIGALMLANAFILGRIAGIQKAIDILQESLDE